MIYRSLQLATGALLLAACGDTKRVVEHIPTPPDRLICERAGTRPAIPPEHQIDWSQVRTIPQAQAEHEKYKAVIRTREGIVAGYVLKLEGQLFTCWTNMQWRRDYEAGLSAPSR
jgi:hypothetical protein